MEERTRDIPLEMNKLRAVPNSTTRHTTGPEPETLFRDQREDRRLRVELPADAADRPGAARTDAPAVRPADVACATGARWRVGPARHQGA